MDISGDFISIAYTQEEMQLLTNLLTVTNSRDRVMTPFFGVRAETSHALDHRTNQREAGGDAFSPPSRYPPEEKLKNPSWGPSKLETKVSWLSNMTFGETILKHIFWKKYLNFNFLLNVIKISKIWFKNNKKTYRSLYNSFSLQTF